MSKLSGSPCARFALLLGFGAVLSLAPTAGRAQTTPVTVTITHIEQIGSDFDPTSLGDFYAHVTIDGTTLSTFDDRFSFDSGFISPSGDLIPPSPWVLTRDVPIALGTVPVRIELFDDDLLTGRETADLNPGPGDAINIVVDLATGLWSGDVNWPQSCLNGGPFLDDNSAEVCFDISVLSASGDADGDGLLDGWELRGMNDEADGTIDVDLPAMGANPFRKDIFVEVDCLVASTHNHCPRSDSMADAVRSFANAPVSNPDGTTGIQLHADVGPLYGIGVVTPIAGTGGVTGNVGDLGGGGSQIAEAGHEIIEDFGGDAQGATDFFSLKIMDPLRKYVFRYALFGHQTNNRRPTNDCTSGQARGIPALNFFVTLGGVNPSGDPCHVVDINGLSVGSRAEQAGTFMHELGHTLGLQHGGGDGNNRKPHYFSVMSYVFQDCLVPISPNGLLPGGCDYSRILLDPLKETDLDECAGLDGGALGFGQNDWDGDGVIEGASNCTIVGANTKADINNDGICVEPGANSDRDSTLAGDDATDHAKVTDGRDRTCDTSATPDDTQATAVGSTPSQPETLNGFEDWNQLKYSLLEIVGDGDDAGAPQDEPDPQTVAEARGYLAALLAPKVTLDQTGPATAVPGDVLTYTSQIGNAAGFGPGLGALLSDTSPDGSVQASDVGAVLVGSQLTRTRTFTVPQSACPGDFTSAGASIAFKDMAGNTLVVSDSTPLQILDVAAPVVTVSVTPSTLWPPNHKLVDVAATLSVVDNCDAAPVVTLVSIVSNEPEAKFLGNGDKSPDVEGAAVGTDDRAFSLRSERGTGPGSTGRVYTVTYRAVDSVGNASETSSLVTVPLNQGN